MERSTGKSIIDIFHCRNDFKNIFEQMLNRSPYCFNADFLLWAEHVTKQGSSKKNGNKKDTYIWNKNEI